MIKSFIVLTAFASTVALHAGEMSVPGLAIGARAPGFALKNSAGADVTLASLLDRGPIALVFYRSADWCPYCKKQLQDLQKNLGSIEQAGVRLVGISYDSVAVGAAATAKLGVAFPLLSDAGSKVIDAYGIRNATAKGRAEGIPHPVVFLVDRQGVIRAKLARDNYRDRPESAEIIAAAKALK
ncbi:MAG: peroxiredoxin family protein [Opitutaceae bacterium]|nr:peroxiredoxin family protein [Opitutaceae bacterium]